MKKSILICVFLMGGVAVTLSVLGHRDDVVRAAVEAREPAADDTPAPAPPVTAQNARLIFQLGEQKHHSVACADGKFSLLHREGNQKQEEQGHTGEKPSHQDQNASSHRLFELNGTLTALPQGKRLLLTYQASWEFSEHQKKTADHVDQIDLAREQHDKDGAFAVSGNVVVRPGQTYMLGSFGDTKLTVRVVVGEEDGGALKVSGIRSEKAERVYEDAWTEKLEQALKHVPGVDANVAAIGELESIEDASKHGRDRALAHPLTPKRLAFNGNVTSSYFESIWLKENPPQEGTRPK